jgi:hypothetical protein
LCCHRFLACLLAYMPILLTKGVTLKEIHHHFSSSACCSLRKPSTFFRFACVPLFSLLAYTPILLTKVNRPHCPFNDLADVDGTRASPQQTTHYPRGCWGIPFVVNGSHQRFQTHDVCPAFPWLWGRRKTSPVLGASQILSIAPLV